MFRHVAIVRLDPLVLREKKCFLQLPVNLQSCFDIIKKEKQLHVSARGHRQVGFFGFARKNAFCNALLFYNGWRGERDLFLQSVGVFLGVCCVCRILVVGPLAWRLQALWCGRCSWAGPSVFWVSLGFVGFSLWFSGRPF
jgi:hypothetical protein